MAQADHLIRLGSMAALVLWTLAYTSPQVNPWRLEQLRVGITGIGRADDLGLYLVFAPFVSAGLAPAATMTLATLIASAAALAIVPLRLLPFGMVALGLALQVGDLYVIPAAAIVAGLPLLLERRRLPIVAAIALVAELFRSGAGLPLLVGLVLVAPRRWRLWLPAAAGYALIHAVSGHVFWHTLYLGLGWAPNPYGLTYLDDVAKSAVSADVPYNTPEYDAAVRDAFIRLALADPVFVVGTFVAKTLAMLDIRAVLIVLAAALLRRPVLLPIAAAAMIPAIVGDVRWSYQLGYHAAVLMAIGVALARRGSAPGSSASRSPRRTPPRSCQRGRSSR